jgi:hypothetical protein
MACSIALSSWGEAEKLCGRAGIGKVRREKTQNSVR